MLISSNTFDFLYEDLCSDLRVNLAFIAWGREKLLLPCGVLNLLDTIDDELFIVQSDCGVNSTAMM